MKSFKLGLILSALVLFIFACAQNDPKPTAQDAAPPASQPALNPAQAAPPPPPTAAANDEFAGARRIYAEQCAVCHKEDGAGGEVELEGAKFKVPSYKSDKAMRHADEKLYDYIENGDDEMPAYKGKLTDHEMKTLVKFIRREFQNK